MKNGMIRGLLKALAIVGIGYAIFYYVAYSSWKNNSFKDIDITYNDGTSEVEPKKEDKKEKDYSNLYDSVKFEYLEYNYGEEFYDYYYGSKDFDSKFYIYYAIINLLDNENIINCNLEKEISSLDVKKKINDVFGDVLITNASFTTANNYLDIQYDASSDKYYVKINDKCSGFDYSNGGIKNEYYDAEVKGNYLYIYEKALYLDYSYDSTGNIIYNYHNGINKNSSIAGNSYSSINLDNLPTYVYKFELKDGMYKFISVNKK